MRAHLIAVLVLCNLLPPQGVGCLWDSETRVMELQQFPGTMQLITGDFVRHSEAYYDWRIAKYEKLPEAELTAAEFDDLAVAYDKTENHEKAIEIIHRKMDRWPDEGKYESEANLGTFLIHAGRFAEGLPHIERALEINPDAHFGRERYQKLLVEYVIQQRTEHDTLPLFVQPAEGTIGFAQFVLAQRKTERKDIAKELKDATKGITGMMRFGQHDSPILLEALGDLLVATENPVRNESHAVGAYLKASYGVTANEAINAYREKAVQVAANAKPGIVLTVFEAGLRESIEQGKLFQDRIAQSEKGWVEAGANLDQAFQDEFYAGASIEAQANQPAWGLGRFANRWSVVLGFILATLAATIVFGVLQSRRAKPTESNLPIGE